MAHATSGESTGISSSSAVSATRCAKLHWREKTTWSARPGGADTDEWRENSIFDAAVLVRVPSTSLRFFLFPAPRVNPAPETRQSESTTGKYRPTVWPTETADKSGAVDRTVITSMIMNIFIHQEIR